MLIFRSISGFLIQIVPCAFFCFYPFSGCCKFKKRNVFGFLTGIILLMAMLFTCVHIHAPSRISSEQRELLVNLVFYLTLLILLMVYIFCIRSSLAKKLFVFFIIMNYGFLVTQTIDLLIPFLPRAVHDGYLYLPQTLLLYFLFTGIFFFPMLFLMERIRKALESPVEEKLWRILTLVPGIFIGICVLSETALLTALPVKTVHMITIQLILFFMLFIYFLIFTVIEESRKNAWERTNLELMVDNYRSLAANTSKIREIRHETIHHMNALSLYLNNDDYDGAKEYLRKISDIITELPVIEYSSHPLLNSILTEYRERAAKSNIRTDFRIGVPNTISMDEVDLCQFLTNMLDNALQGCRTVEPQSRYLTLRIRQNGNFVLFSCENSCNPTALLYRNGSLASTKPSNGSHGFGISVMGKIAEKYNGTFQTATSENKFTASANLCLSSSKTE